MKRTRYFLGLFVTLMLVCLGLNIAVAYEGDGANTPDKPNTWCQFCSTNPSVYDVNTPLADSSGYTMGEAACGQFSMTQILVKSCAKPVGYAPWDWNKELRKEAAKDSSLWYSPGWVNWEKIEGLTNGKLKYVPSKVVGNPYSSVGVSYIQNAEEEIKKLADDYFLVLLVPGHYIAVDFIGDDGKVHITDSARTSEVLNHPVAGIIPFEAKNLKAKDAVHSVDIPEKDPCTGLPKTSEEAQSGTKMLGGIISEDDLVGMPNVFDMTEGSETTPLAGSESISSAQERFNISELSTQIKDRSTSSLVKNIRLGISFIGVLLMFYGLIIVLAALFDAANSFFSAKLMRVVTFGNREFSSAKAAERSGDQIGWLGVGVIAGVAFVVGILITAGLVFDLGYWVVSNWSEWWG